MTEREVVTVREGRAPAYSPAVEAMLARLIVGQLCRRRECGRPPREGRAHCSESCLRKDRKERRR